MNNTIQLYIDDDKEIKGYPLTSPDRVVDEYGINIETHLNKKTNDLQSQIDVIVRKSSGDSNLEVAQARVNDEGLIFNTLKDNIRNIESGKLKDLELQHTVGTNKMNDAIVKDIPFSGNFTFLVTDSESLIIGKRYKLRIWFTNGTSVSASNAIWKFNYVDGTRSEGSVSVTADNTVQKKVVSITVEYVNTSSTDYKGFVYDKIMLTDANLGNISYESYTRTYKSKTLERLGEKMAQLENIGDFVQEITDARTNSEGSIFATLKDNLNNIEEKKLSELMLVYSSNSENKLNDSVIKGQPYKGKFTISDIDKDALIIGESFKLLIYFKDNTQVVPSNAVWKFNYTDGTTSTDTASVASYREVKKEVKSISVDFVADANTMYANKIYLGAKLSNIKTDKSLDYIPFEFVYKSKKLKQISDSIEKLSSKDGDMNGLYTTSTNLFNFNDIEVGKELQPYNVVTNADKAITGFIPVKKGDSLFVYPGIGGSQVANLYDANKAKIDWITLNTSPNNENKITKDNVAYIRFNIPKSYLETVKDNFVVSTSKITKYVPYKIIDPTKNNIDNTSINWWNGKKGDSLGDSLTGQGFFQKYTSMYYNLDSFKNHGIGGSKLTGEDVDQSRPSMWKDERINALRADADFITILGGQNDGNVTIGNISKTNMDVNTYVGALNTIIDKIYKKYNGRITIILCTPFYVPSEGDDGERFIQLDKAVKEVGQLHGLPVADFGGMCGANKYVKDIYWTSADYTHPIEDFYRDKIAPILIETMDKIKPIDFRKVNSIEYGVTQ